MGQGIAYCPAEDDSSSQTLDSVESLWNIIWWPFLCLRENLRKVDDLNIKELDTIRYVQSLGLTLAAIHKFASNRMKYPTDVLLDHFKPRDWVLSKFWKNRHPDDQLELKWVGPYQILLTTHFSVKLERVKPWIRTTLTGVKSAPDVWPPTRETIPSKTTAQPHEYSCKTISDCKMLFRRKTSENLD